ncbi:hypothetical protein EYV94_03585 [Puteibacter caeruleilacunae]|nr:hypothetical protein EYV94_03585 [Puteibacter caeruleilacunae]
MSVTTIHLLTFNTKEYSRIQYSVECGFTNGDNRIGQWKYFSNKGTLDSVVNYDNEYIISFGDFYRIASIFGMVGENSLMKSRKGLMEISTELGLKLKMAKYTSGKRGWPNQDLYPIELEEKNNMFYTIFSYSRKTQTWLATKIFKVSDHTLNKKNVHFSLQYDITKKEIIIFESNISLKESLGAIN